MITFKQFLSEQSDEVREMLHRDCGPYIRESNGGLIYRGIKGLSPDAAEQVGDTKYWVKQVRKDRKSLSTVKRLHTLIDDWFFEKFGVRARTQAMFCAGSPDDLGGYGPVHIVVPIGEFKYVWSPKVRDLYHNTYWQDDYQDISYDSLEEMGIEKLQYTDDGLDKAIASKNEIMIACDRYYVFEMDDKATVEKAMK